jgi:hypothetical protein
MFLVQLLLNRKLIVSELQTEVVKPDQGNNRCLFRLAYETHKYTLWANVYI